LIDLSGENKHEISSLKDIQNQIQISNEDLLQQDQNDNSTESDSYFFGCYRVRSECCEYKHFLCLSKSKRQTIVSKYRLTAHFFLHSPTDELSFSSATIF
jgi:hypothetical protein